MFKNTRVAVEKPQICRTGGNELSLWLNVFSGQIGNVHYRSNSSNKQVVSVLCF